MNTHHLQVQDLSVSVGTQRILSGINLSIKPGEVHVLFGPNGSGKSSLLCALMGLPPYQVDSGTIRYSGKDIQTLPIDERARMGIGMTFQRPPALDGVSLADLYATLATQAHYTTQAKALDLGDFSQRDINVGFSGGEIKRWEILKLILQDPQLLLFDEPESGVDLEHIAAVGKAIERLLQTPRAGVARSALIITHTGFILDYVQAHRGHMLVNGVLQFSEDPDTLFARIKREGYQIPA